MLNATRRKTLMESLGLRLRSMTTADLDLGPEIDLLTSSDLESRSRTSECWGVTDARKRVARAALAWAKKVLKDELDAEASDHDAKAAG